MEMLKTAWSCHEAGPGGFFMLKIDVAAIHGAAEPSRKNTAPTNLRVIRKYDFHIFVAYLRQPHQRSKSLFQVSCSRLQINKERRPSCV